MPEETTFEFDSENGELHVMNSEDASTYRFEAPDVPFILVMSVPGQPDQCQYANFKDARVEVKITAIK